MVSLEDQGVDPMAVNGHTPLVRDWTIYATADAISTARLAAPNATVVIRYGSGASAFERRSRIAMVGTVTHVVATWVDVQIEVADSGLPAVGDIRVAAYASPGRPSKQVIAEHMFYSLFVPGAPIPIPPFAIGWHGVQNDNTATTVLDGVWRYEGVNRMGVGPGITATATDEWQTQHAIPRDATELVLLPVDPPAPVHLHWWWTVLG